MKSFQVRAYVKGGDMIVIHNCLYLIAPSAGDNTLVITVRDDNSGSHSVWIMGVVTFFVDACDM